MLSWLFVGFIAGFIFLGFSIVMVLLIMMGTYNMSFIIHIPIFLFTAIISSVRHSKNTQLVYKAQIKLEKFIEDKNTLENNYNRHLHLNESLNKRLERFVTLKNFSEQLSSTLSIDQLSHLIIDITFSIIGKSQACFLFSVDETKLDLNLIHSKHPTSILGIKNKKGDIFDQWVLRRRKPLLIPDKNKDFRFNYEKSGDTDRNFRAIISCPMITENRIVGTIRLDSEYQDTYTSDDLRLLDIISDLSAVAIENANLYQKLEELAIKDDLTQVFVKRYFESKLDEEFNRAVRFDYPLSFFMIDIDYFKRYNDNFGHKAGDKVLKEVAKTLINKTTSEDVVSRYGGEEFCIILPNITKSDAIKIAEEIRKAIESKIITLRRKPTKITVSIGVASFPEDTKFKQNIIEIADNFLYKAKKEGRNRVCFI